MGETGKGSIRAKTQERKNENEQERSSESEQTAKCSWRDTEQKAKARKRAMFFNIEAAEAPK